MMNSLKVKMLALVALIVVVIVSASAILNVRQQKQIIQGISNRAAQTLAETIKTAIAEGMRTGHTSDVGSVFFRLRSQNNIRSLRIINHEGRVLASADAEEVGHILPGAELDTIRSGSHGALHTHASGSIFHTISPIHNGPQCSRCHDPRQQTLGLLEMEMSFDYLAPFMKEGKRQTFITTAGIIALILVFISLFFHIYVDQPIQRLVRGMIEVEKGDFRGQEEITSSKEMRLLFRHFNHMVERLRSLMETTVEHEVELAKAEEKLAHHQEIHQMNFRLAEQIKEIEDLNVVLEERIQEIEEANYKIADLAGELEDKNFNLEKAVAKLSTLYKVGLGINSIMELDRLFNLIVKTTMDALHAQIGYIVLYTARQGVIRIKALHGLGDSADGHLMPMRPGSVAAWVINNRRPLLVNDIAEMPEFDRYSVLGYERKTLVAAPLSSKDGIIGTVTVVNKIDDTVYTNDDLELLTTIAAQASIAITNAKLYDDQQRTYMNTIHALVSAIEANDSYTRGHSERVTRYSIQLASRLGLSEDRMKILERAAILHDIGKIGINVAILNKEGALTEEEVAELQQHPAIGMRILEPIEFLYDVRLCIGQHHERYDGSGYPESVPPEHLLLESRILAIADAFDAMTSDRPYRKALSRENAISELRKNAGTQFDPELVSHFIDMLGVSPLFEHASGGATGVSDSAA